MLAHTPSTSSSLPPDGLPWPSAVAGSHQPSLPIARRVEHVAVSSTVPVDAAKDWDAFEKSQRRRLHRLRVDPIRLGPDRLPAVRLHPAMTVPVAENCWEPNWIAALSALKFRKREIDLFDYVYVCCWRNAEIAADIGWPIEQVRAARKSLRRRVLSKTVELRAILAEQQRRWEWSASDARSEGIRPDY